MNLGKFGSQVQSDTRAVGSIVNLLESDKQHLTLLCGNSGATV